MSVFSHALAFKAGVPTDLTLADRLGYENAAPGHFFGHDPAAKHLYHSIIKGGGVCARCICDLYCLHSNAGCRMHACKGSRLLARDVHHTATGDMKGACGMRAQVFTFAGPRVGDLTYIAYNGNCYEGKIFRIVHSADLVPKVRITG